MQLLYDLLLSCKASSESPTKWTSVLAGKLKDSPIMQLLSTSRFRFTLKFFLLKLDSPLVWSLHNKFLGLALELFFDVMNCFSYNNSLGASISSSSARFVIVSGNICFLLFNFKWDPSQYGNYKLAGIKKVWNHKIKSISFKDLINLA